MTNAPFFSVVMPLYNKAAWVRRAIESIRAQAFADFEVIVVDDGSTDDSLARATTAAAGDPRFVFVRQANGGVSRARNAGLARARAGWVAFLDADDEWLPGYLGTVAEVCDRFPQSVLISADYIDRTAGVDTLVDRGLASAGHVVAGYDFYGAWAHAGSCPAWICASVIRADVLRAVGGFPAGVQLGEDLLTFIAVVARGTPVFVHERLAVYYRDSLDSLARAPSARAVRSHARLLAELERLCAAGTCPAAVRDIHRDIHVHHLIRASMRADLWRYLLSMPAYWSPRTWALSMLELLGLRGLLKSWLRPGST